MPKLTPGSKLGCWTLKHRIGEGGNSIVWECDNSTTGQQGALKVLKSYLLQTTKDSNERERRHKRLKRFLNEISFLRSKQETQGIIGLFDSHLPNSPTSEERPWLVMPLATPLPQFLKSNEYSFRRVVEIFRDLAATLDTLHSEGTTHRDIKPDNILLVDGVPCLSDFGLVDFHEKESITCASEILGPLFFVAPEMMSDAVHTKASSGDVYSLAKSFWVSASGQKYPLPGEQRLGIPALSLSAYVPDPRAKLLDPILDRATRVSPQERPLAREFYEELTAWCQPHDLSLPMIVQLKQVSHQSITDVSATAQRELRRQKLVVDWAEELMSGAEKRLSQLSKEFNSTLGSSHIIKGGFLNYTASEVLIHGKDSFMQKSWLEGIKPLWKRMVAIETVFSQANGPEVVLICGVALIVLKDSTALIRSGVLIDVRRDETLFEAVILNFFRKPWQIIFAKKCKVSAGGAKAEAELNKLVTEIFNKSPNIAEEFGRKIRQFAATQQSLPDI